MLSVLIPARNGVEMTRACLATTLWSLRALKLEGRVEFTLLDDDSDPALGVTNALLGFRALTTAPVSVFRFRKRQHYTRAFAYGLSRCRGHVLFISNDMRMTPGFLRTVLAVSAIDDKIGIVRGTSAHTDSLPEHIVRPSEPLAGHEDEVRFAESLAEQHRLEYVEDNCLSADAVLIRRAVIDKIGTFDRRFYGYFGDQDYGLRAQRAGFKLVCAKGAWLVHLAEGYVKEDAKSVGADMGTARLERMKIVAEAYALFREKWGSTLPPSYPGVDHMDFERLRNAKKLSVRSYEPPIGVEGHLVEAL